MRAMVWIAMLWSTWAGAQATPPKSTSCLEPTIAIGLMPEKRDRPPDLKNATFRATVGGQAVQVLSASPGPPPRHVLLLIDTSGSMSPQGNAPSKVELAFLLAADAVKRLPASTSVAVMFFGKREETFGFDTTREELTRILRPDQRSVLAMTKGTTALRDAIYDALRFIPSPQPGDVIYVFTDGGDNQSTSREQAVRHALQAAGVRLFAFMTIDPAPPAPDEREGPQSINSLVKVSGGALATFFG
jgi:uncharacterized protein with von Willebrand factor type A (vWA) domain